MEKSFFTSSVWAESARAPKINTYGGNGFVAEHEVNNAYAEFMSAAMAIGTDMNIYAEQADIDAGEQGIVHAFLYAEAEGGFFKKILNALIKVYTKAKDFVVKLLGRVKSDKSYRTDLTYLESIIASALKVTYNDNASITVKKSRYVPLACIVIGIMRENSILLDVAEGKEGTITVDKINTQLKEIISGFESDDKTKAIKAVKDQLDKLRGDYPTKDQWLKDVYGKAIADVSLNGADKNVGDADFGKNSSGTALEAVNKLWDNNTKVLKGDKDIKDFLNKQFNPIFGLANGIKYDTISKALEKGVTELSDKIDDLKGLLKDVESSSSRATASANSSEDAKKNAQAGTAMSVSYSNLMSNYTVVVTEGFNTAKIQLDRLIAEFKGIAGEVDKVRKNSSNTAVKPEVKQAEDAE